MTITSSLRFLYILGGSGLLCDATMTQNFSKGMEANFRSIFHKLMAMPESKINWRKKSWIRGGRIFCQRYQKIILVVCFDLDEFVEFSNILL